MSLALTAIGSFVLGVFVSLAACHVLWTYSRNAGARAYIGGIFRGMNAYGIETLRVETSIGTCEVRTLELARSVETALISLPHVGERT